jgi:hypothetical protein
MLPYRLPPQLTTLLLSSNALTGPALPPAWQREGALIDWATDLELAGNRGLTGTLPAKLPWTVLNIL